jgi:ribosomal protein S18 acetylase RimI-like enzyme
MTSTARPPAVAIRRLGVADAAAFRAIRLEALRDTPSAFGSSPHEIVHRPLEWFAARLDGGEDTQAFGAEVDGHLAGIVVIARERAAKERHRAEIQSMFVSAAHRGRGLGAALLRRALAAADAMPGLRHVVLTVTRGNDAARALYDAEGFTAYGTLPDALFVDGRYYDDVLMVRRCPGGRR